MITDTAKYLLMVLCVIVGFIIGYQVGHYFGKLDGVTIEKANHTNIAATAGNAAAVKREITDDKVRKMPESAIDVELSNNGWLR